ncbi:MAG: SDR family oxidoreductase [Pseudomonadota bacterium]|nr:SDR family oxidoreductase [Pseudomonadota bacterium]
MLSKTNFIILGAFAAWQSDKIVCPASNEWVETLDFHIEGKRALITGASGGIGHAAARYLAEEGVRLTLSDEDAAKLSEMAREMGADHAAADLSSTKGCEELIGKIGTDFDIWVHATGVTGAKGDPLEMSDEDWDDALNIDFLSAVRLARHLCRPMIDRGWGRVVFVTSENVAQPYPDETVYNSAKSALLSFSKSVAMQHSKSGLLVNCVAPAFIETPMTDGMMEKRAKEIGVSKEEAIESFLKEDRPYLVLGRRGKAEEVGAVIAMLCSEQASFVTGANWRVDGGSVGSINV